MQTYKQIVTYLIDRGLEQDFSDWLKKRQENNESANALTASQPPVVIALYGLGFRRAEAKIKDQFAAFMMQQAGGTDPERGVHIDTIVTGLYGIERDDAEFDQAKRNIRQHLFTLGIRHNFRKGNAGVGFVDGSFYSETIKQEYFVYFIPALATSETELPDLKEYEAFLEHGHEDEIENFIDTLFEKMPREKFSEACDRFIFLHSQPELGEDLVDFLLKDEDSLTDIIPIFKDFQSR